MDRVLVEVFVPASNDSYDVFISVTSKLYEVNAMLANTMTELSQGYYIASIDTPVCNKETGEILDINKTVEELKLSNGSKLMLL